MTKRINVLLQTTIEHVANDWHIGRFSMLRRAPRFAARARVRNGRCDVPKTLVSGNTTIRCIEEALQCRAILLQLERSQ